MHNATVGASAQQPSACRGDTVGPEPAAQGVRRRHVFFIAGFDPKSARYYHALYRSQARRQAEVSGLRLQVDKAREQTSAHSSAWDVLGAGPAGPVHTRYEMLLWDDIVRQHWAGSAWRVWYDGLRTVLFGLRDGAVQRMYRLYRPPVYATLFPLVALLLCALLAASIGSGSALLLGRFAGWHAAAAWGAGAVAALLLTLLAGLLVHRIHFTWLLRLVRFTHLQCTGRVPGIDTRLDAFAERIAAVLHEPADEVLVVGHSVGATLAVSVLARVLALERALPGPAAAPAPASATGPDQGGTQPSPPIDPLRQPVQPERLRESAGLPALRLLSLGHCIPLMTALSPAQAQRQDLRQLAAAAIDWLDISAPIDWAAFPGVDPVSGAGLPPAPPGWHPRLVSPRFHQLFGADTYARLRRNRFQVHLQYLMAAERPGVFDYFAITAGPQTLRQRFASAESPE